MVTFNVSILKRDEPALYAWTVALLIPALAVVRALTQPIEAHAHDAATLHIYRAVLFSAARAEGWFFPVWSQALNAGLGGPLFSFYPPLLYFALDGLHALGLSFPLAYRLLVALALILASTGAFALVLALGGRIPGALTAAAIFTYALPLLRDLFERGSPQGMALALSPWALWGLVRAVQFPGGLRLAVAAVLWALIILTHNLSALLLLPVLGLLALTLLAERGRRWAWLPVAVVGGGFLLAAFSILPFLLERDFVQLDNITQVGYVSIAENPLRLSELLQSPPGYDVGLDNNAIGDRLGLLPAFLLLLGAVGAWLGWRAGRRQPAILMAGFVLVGLMVLASQTSAADGLWRAVPALALIQFRTRLLGLVALSGAVIAGLLVFHGRWRWQTTVVRLLGVLAVLGALPVLYPELQYQYATFDDPLTVRRAQLASLEQNTPGLTAFNEFLPRWRYQPITGDDLSRVEASPLANLPEGGRILEVERTARRQEVRLETPLAFTARWHLLYFPGWAAYVDGQPRPLRPLEASGYALLDLPAGTHTVTLRYEGTFAQRLGGWISGLAGLALLVLAFWWRGGEVARPATVAAPGDGSTDFQPRWWLPVALILVVGLKTLWLDPQTTIFRGDSSCVSTRGAEVQVDVRFGDALRLCGYRLAQTTFRPGDWLEITLYWQAEAAPSAPADSFVHLLGATFNPETGDPLWGQQDKQLPGGHPLTGWRAGKLYRDVYRFQVPAHTPPGPYRLEIGWLQPGPGARLKPVILAGGADVSVSHLDALLVSGIVVE